MIGEIELVVGIALFLLVIAFISMMVSASAKAKEAAPSDSGNEALGATKPEAQTTELPSSTEIGPASPTKSKPEPISLEKMYHYGPDHPEGPGHWH